MPPFEIDNDLLDNYQVTETFERICILVKRGSVRISEHGYDEMAADAITARDVIGTVLDGTVVEDYPSYPKGPCILVRQTLAGGKMIHVVWGIPKGHAEPAVVVTAYVPDPEKWSGDFLRRKR